MNITCSTLHELLKMSKDKISSQIDSILEYFYKQYSETHQESMELGDFTCKVSSSYNGYRTDTWLMTLYINDVKILTREYYFV